MKSKSTAGLLSFFLGGLGVHRFYLGQTGLGFLYLVFFWTFIPVILGLIDAIIFWTISENSFNNKYNLALKQFMQSSTSAPSLSVTEKLERLASLKERGMLTDDEFNQQKAQLLA
jgi:TM2 domain-containing membrane protein YozV